MCEFDVMLDGEKVFEEAVYLQKKDENSLLIRNILGQEETFNDVSIEKVDVPSEELILSKI